MGVSPKEKMFFAEHLSLMIKGGIPISEALETLKSEAKSRRMRKALDDILKRVLEGARLEKSFEKHPRIFDRFFRNVIRVGEESGTLEENLRYLSLQIRKDYELKRKVMGALLYPFLVIFLAIAIILMVMFFVIPKIVPLFQALQQIGVAGDIPFTTKFLISFSSFLKKFWFLIILAFLFFFFIFKILQKIRFIKFYFDKISLSLPFLSQIYKNLNLSRFSRNLYTLLKSGMPILESLEICADSLPNEIYKRNVMKVRSGVERGEKMSSGLKKLPQNFPAVFSEMVLVGEKTGSLEESLFYLAGFYEGEVDSALENISNIIGPILLIFIGIFVVLIALSTIIPIYQFIGEIRVR